MRKPADITRKYQFAYMVGRQLSASIICFVIQLLFLITLFNYSFLRILIGCVMMIIYFSYMYTGAKGLGESDSKSYTPLSPDIKFSLFWGVLLLAMNIVMYAVYLKWGINAQDIQGTRNVFSGIVNGIFFMWNSPCIGFIFTNKENINYIVVPFMTIVPILSCVAGYVAGVKNFSIMEKLRGFAYEKDSDEQ